MKKTATYLLALALLVCAGCRKEHKPGNPSDRNCITFYVVQEHPDGFNTKALIEDTDDLLRRMPPIYVTDEGSSAAFKNTEIKHYSNGVWRSDQTWKAEQSYTFFGYVNSDANGTKVSENGAVVELTEPSAYSSDSDKWSDYLMSYRVNANGSNTPLIRLELERITAGVQLFLSRKAGLDITVTGISFTDVYTKAKYSLTYHASASDSPSEGNYNMKNVWAVPSDSYDGQSNYELTGLSYIPEEYDETTGRFAEANLVMSFLAPHQSASGKYLNISYTSKENGVEKYYNASFDLGAMPVSVWARGHRVRYYINFDTSLKLEGSIVEWRTLDDIEVTILPPLD